MDIWVASSFFFFAIMNNAGMNIYAQVFLCDKFLFLLYIPGSEEELLGHMVTLCLTFWGTTKLYSKVVAPFYLPISNEWGFQFFHILTNTC